MPDMLVRYKKGKTTFEVLTVDGSVSKYRSSELKSLSDVLVSEGIFTDLKKGKKASKEELAAAFEGKKPADILDAIVSEGAVQVSAGERKDKTEAKRREVATYIHKNYVDGKGKVVPLARVENALDTLRPRIDAAVSAMTIVNGLMPKLIEILPLKKGGATVTASCQVPSKFTGAAGGVVRKHATVLDEEFGPNGVQWKLEVFDTESLLRELAKTCKGEYKFEADGLASGAKEIGDVDTSAAPASKAGKKTRNEKKGRDKGKGKK